MRKFRIGHPAYQCSNRPFDCVNINRAVMELIGRGVAPLDARQVCRRAEAAPDHFFTVWTRKQTNVIEIKYV